LKRRLRLCQAARPSRAQAAERPLAAAGNRLLAAAGGAYFAFPGYLVLISQIMIVGLFAVSLDLILGYAGIVSLGHAAFFGWAPTLPACWRCTAGANR
jgi:hypothetical protein